MQRAWLDVGQVWGDLRFTVCCRCRVLSPVLSSAGVKTLVGGLDSIVMRGSPDEFAVVDRD